MISTDSWHKLNDAQREVGRALEKCEDLREEIPELEEILASLEGVFSDFDDVTGLYYNRVDTH